MRIIAKAKPLVFLFDKEYERNKSGIKAVEKVFCQDLGFSKDDVKTVVTRYPPILSKTEEEIHQFFSFLQEQGLTKGKAMWSLKEAPRLISIDMETQLKEIVFLFELYHNISKKDTIKIFKSFPYLLCVPPRKIQRFLAEFRKYRMTPQQIIKVCSESGGLLASRISNFIGLFDQLRVYGVKASEVVNIIHMLPEFALQNRKDLIKRKLELIKKESQRDDVYIKNFIKRHPDILLK